MDRCHRCGCTLSPEQTVFDADGRPHCAACQSAAKMQEDAFAVTPLLRGLAYAGLAIALVSFVFNPWLIGSLGSVGCGAYVYHAIAHAPSSCRREGDGGDGLVKIAWAAMGLAAGSLIIHGILALR